MYIYIYILLTIGRKKKIGFCSSLILSTLLKIHVFKAWTCLEYYLGQEYTESSLNCNMVLAQAVTSHACLFMRDLRKKKSACW